MLRFSIMNNLTIILLCSYWSSVHSKQFDSIIPNSSNSSRFLTSDCSSNVFSKDCRTRGSPSVLALRVVAQDSETTTTLDEMRGYISDENSITLFSQFADCSYDKFTPQPFSGVTTTGQTIEGGVVQITLAENVVNEQSATVAHLVQAQANQDLGDLKSQFDFVMFCLPPGTKVGFSSSWKAYAFINSWISIYNDENCNYLSVQMHELGHNLGLSHSNSEANYGDKTGYMGITSSLYHEPRKCFNGPKTFQLGWFSDSQYVFDAATSPQHAAYYLYGIDKNSDEPTVIQIINTEDGFDYYLFYNDATSDINSGTGMAAGEMLVTKRPLGVGFEDSEIINVLKESAQYTILTDIYEISILRYESSEKYADIGLTKVLVSDGGVASGLPTDESCQTDQDCVAGEFCTVGTCDTVINTCSYDSVTCSECGGEVTVDVTTAAHPERITWSFWNMNSKEIAWSSKYYQNADTASSSSRCLGFGKYKFIIDNSDNTTDTNVPYALRISNQIVDDGELEQLSEIIAIFTICETNADCIDYDGCTIDYCNPSTNLCDNQQQDCISCKWFNITLTPDNFPVETDWSLTTSISNDFVMSGDPYPFVTFGFGRSKSNTKFGRSKSNTRSNADFSNRRKLRPRILEEDDETMKDFLCLETLYTYHFTITDSFGDGICCSEGNGEYKLILNDNVIKSGSDFGDIDQVTFKYMECNSDTDCIDSFDCTTDRCDTQLSTCFYTQKPCSECGSYVQVRVIPDAYGSALTWTITNVESTENLIMSGGPYSADYIEVIEEKCLEKGNYVFIFRDDAEDGFTTCYTDEVVCGFALSIDGTSILEKETYDYFDKVEKSFEIQAPMTDSSLLDWVIDFSHVSMLNRTALHGLNLHYNISKGKSKDQVAVSILDEACHKKVNDSAIIVNEVDLVRHDTEVFDDGVISLTFNKTSFEKSSLWKNVSDGAGVLAFCVRSDLLLIENYDTSVSFCETTVNISVMLESGFASFNIDNILLDRKDASDVQKNAAFDITACVCGGIAENGDYQCDESPAMTQNSLLKICIEASDEMVISEFEEVVLYQDGVAKFIPVENGITNSLTSTSTGSVAVLETRLISVFFMKSDLLPIKVVGKVLLDFSNERSLKETDEKVNERNQVTFDLQVNLSETNSILSPNLSISLLILSVICVGFFIYFRFKRSWTRYQLVDQK